MKPTFLVGAHRPSCCGVQLVGCGAMLVAAKYEEIYAPEIRDFVYISDKVRQGCSPASACRE